MADSEEKKENKVYAPKFVRKNPAPWIVMSILLEFYWTIYTKKRKIYINMLI